MGAQDDAATTVVLNVLRDRSIREIDFVLGSISIKPTMYEKVSQAITDKKISVLVAPNQLASDEIGKYFNVLTINKDTELYDVLVLRTPDLGSSVNETFHRQAAIVHECTHALLDLLQVPNMTHTQHEACAYVAESIFQIAKMKAMNGHPDRVPQTQPIQGAAWEIGLMQINSKGATEGYYASPVFMVDWWLAVNKLCVAIMNSNTYKGVALDPVINDGVGRQWKLPPTPSSPSAKPPASNAGAGRPTP